MPEPAPATATQVALRLAQLSRELDQTVTALQSADRDAVDKRHQSDLDFAHAFLSAQGSVDARKYHALIQTEAIRKEADVADAVVRHLRRKLDNVKVQIDVGRSYGAAVRSEIALGNMGGDP